MVIIVIQNVIQYIKRPGICIKIIRGIWIAIPFSSFFFGQEWVDRAMADPLCSNAKLKWRFIFRKIPSHLTFPIYRLWQARARGVPYFSVSRPKNIKKKNWSRFPPCWILNEFVININYLALCSGTHFLGKSIRENVKYLLLSLVFQALRTFCVSCFVFRVFSLHILESLLSIVYNFSINALLSLIFEGIFPQISMMCWWDFGGIFGASIWRGKVNWRRFQQIELF